MTMLKQFYYNKDGAYPDGELVKGPDGYLYGMTVAEERTRMELFSKFLFQEISV
jgi:hypothetical protein